MSDVCTLSTEHLVAVVRDSASHAESELLGCDVVAARLIVNARRAADRLAELDADKAELWSEVLKLNALRPPCPTCGGTSTDGFTHTIHLDCGCQFRLNYFDHECDLKPGYFLACHNGHSAIEDYDPRTGEPNPARDRKITAVNVETLPCPDCVDGKASISRLVALWSEVESAPAKVYEMAALWLAVRDIPVRVVPAGQANEVDLAKCKGHNALRDELQKALV